MENLLTICIPTFNRPEYVKETVSSFISQVREYNIAICISDNSEDEFTEIVVGELRENYRNIFYHRNETNLGIDRNIVNAVAMASTKFVWIFGDDDDLAPHAVSKMLDMICKNPDVSAFIVNSVPMKADMSSQMSDNLTEIYSDRIYSDANRALEEISWYTTFVGAFVINVDFWNSVDPGIFLDTVFVHVGILFSAMVQQNAKIMFVSERLIKYRTNNASWSSNYLRIQLELWRKTISMLPAFYTANAKTASIESVVFRFVGVGNLVSLRDKSLLNSKSFANIIFPYFASSRKTAINNYKILLTSMVLLFIPAFVAKPIYSIGRHLCGRS
jgi:glycosyltransferase involved in cell wall biosynthesis